MTSSSTPRAADPSRSEAASVPIGSQYIRSLLDRHGVPPSRHSTTIAELLGVNYTLGHRRMNGAVAWELEEIEKIGAHFGETITDIFSIPPNEVYVPAMLLAGTVRVPCQLIPGPELGDPARNSLVAVKLGQQWMVVPATDAGANACFEVLRMRLLGNGDGRWRIAVLDDDPTETASLAQHLADRGCEAKAFTRAEDLVLQMKLRPFDGYVIDWMLEEGTAAELVGMIRADDSDCPIAVLTGKIRSDLMVEPAVAEAISTYKLLFFEKPTRLSIISAQLLQALAGRLRAGSPAS